MRIIHEFEKQTKKFITIYREKVFKSSTHSVCKMYGKYLNDKSKKP